MTSPLKDMHHSGQDQHLSWSYNYAKRSLHRKLPDYFATREANGGRYTRPVGTPQRRLLVFAMVVVGALTAGGAPASSRVAQDGGGEFGAFRSLAALTPEQLATGDVVVEEGLPLGAPDRSHLEEAAARLRGSGQPTKFVLVATRPPGAAGDYARQAPNPKSPSVGRAPRAWPGASSPGSAKSASGHARSLTGRGLASGASGEPSCPCWAAWPGACC